jgi:hypothetical protein
MRARSLGLVALAAVGIGSISLAAVTATTIALDTPSPRQASVIPASPTLSPTAAVAAASPTAPTAPTAPAPSPAASPVPPAPSPTPAARPSPSVRETLVAQGTEPTVAADPFTPALVAVISQNIFMSSPTSGCSRPSVRISKDGGVTWGAPAYPWANQCQDVHATIAWGPGSRLWAADAIGVAGGVAVSATYTEDLGRTWSGRFVQHFTRPWIGCYPSITVDNWPGSPNFGTVYVAYNWLRGASGTGVAVMASRSGTAWVHTEVEIDSPPAGYPFTWTMGYRIKAAPNGSAIVSFYRSSLRSWDESNMFAEGSGGNVGGRAFETALIHFDGKSLAADPPASAVSVDHASAEWQSGLAIDESGHTWMAVENGTGIGVGRLDGVWQSVSIPGKNSFKPSLAVGDGTIFVGWHAEDPDGRVWTYYSLSYDGGDTFLPPTLVTQATWYPGAAASLVNGVGLRENADFANGVFYYVYGDARSGVGVYLAQIQP